MKVKFILFLGVVLSFFSCKKNQVPEGSKKLKSYVAYLSHTIEPALSGVTTFIADQEVYDSDGKLTYSVKGNIIYDNTAYYSKTQYSYTNGLISRTDDGYNIKEFVYSNALLTEADIYYGTYSGMPKDSLRQVEVYSYDTQNRKIKTAIYSNLSKKKQIGAYTYEYNTDNLVVKQVDSNGTITFYEYDGHKNLAKVCYANSSNPGSTSGKESYSYKYNDSGNITEIIQSDYNGLLHKIQILYDDQGRVITKFVLVFENGNFGPLSTVQYSYSYF